MAKSFFNIREEHGAGDDGSDKLVNKYKADTPGQGGTTEPKQKARKGDMLGNKDEPEKSLKPQLQEKLKVSDGQQAWIDDFMKSDAPQFKGKSKEDRAKMAVAAFNAAKEDLKEGLDQKKFAAGAKAMKAYAQKNGGVDKKDFMDVAKMLDQIGRINILQAGQLISQLNRKISGMDTDVRERMYLELKKVGLMESVQIDEAKGKFTDKQIKMAYGILNDPRYKRGNLTGAAKAIEKIAKGLSDHPGVQRAMKATQENVEVDDIDAVIEALIAQEMEEMDMLEESINENWDETRMAMSQLKFIEYAAEEIAEWMEEDMVDMPEWFQNKLTKAFTELQSLHSYVEGDRYDDDEDEEEMDESTKAYGDTMRKQAMDRQKANMKPGEMDKLAKLRKMLDREKKK